MSRETDERGRCRRMELEEKTEREELDRQEEVEIESGIEEIIKDK